MGLPAILGSINTMFKESQINEILKTNQESEKYGLVLTSRDVNEIVESRDDALKSCGRVEISIDVIGKLVDAFLSSPYIDQQNYAPTLCELQEIFYYIKNKTEDRIGDDELIEIIKDLFNNLCGGSLEYLYDCLEEIAEDIKWKSQVTELLMEGGEQWKNFK